ncbi:NUDIX hydrolase [Synechococcus sp. CCY9201]|uniref:NUDIX hydrolase n=1 Tax=Synechococcus sp. CCY9201 TaxID=174697 RepID=UPI002B2163A8|nr:NUDIX hydrolase [Synechococcus sp. CCY9201]MEA5473249.1 NUDIX hydrolase [Synechococcus sp. CCY9201]
MAVDVALAMLQRDGRWLMQLRNESPSIVAPGCWGLFWGHMNPGESPEQAVRRELLEEISWQPQVLQLAMVQQLHRRTAHVFTAELSVPLEQLQLLEGQDMALVSIEELLSGSICSARLGSPRPLANGLLEMMQHVLEVQA